MPFHRPSFLVTKNEATRKLVNAIKSGNINSVKRQINRGANVTSKNVSNIMRNYNMKKNLRNLLESRGALKTKKFETLTAHLNTMPKYRRSPEEIENIMYYATMSKARMENQKEKYEKNRQKRLISNYQKQQESMRPMVMARKRLSNMNAAMTYKNGKPQGLSIKIPKNTTRKVYFNK